MLVCFQYICDCSKISMMTAAAGVSFLAAIVFAVISKFQFGVLLMVGILFAAIGVTIIIVKCAMRCCNL